MRKTLLLLVLLVTSQFAHAITKAEQDCVVRMVYHEARSLDKTDWLKVANTALNRSKHFKEYHYGAKSSNLCDIVRSQQFTSYRKLNSPVTELERFREIEAVLRKSNWKTITTALYFENKGGKMIYNKTWSN